MTQRASPGRHRRSRVCRPERGKALRNEPVNITIVDRRNFHLFQPLLYQVAAAALNPSDIAYPIRSIFRRQQNVRSVLLAEVIGIDLEAEQ